MAGSSSGATKLYLDFEARLEALRTELAQGDGYVEDFGGKVEQTLNRLDQKFGRFGEDSLSNVAQRISSTFRQSLSEIETAAGAAAATGAGGGGTAAISVNVGAAQQAAAAARLQATATREIADAALRAAQAEGGLTVRTKAYVRAAALAASNAEANATRLAEQAGWLQRVQMQLGATTTAQTGNVQASGAMRAGMQQLSYQVGDVVTSLTTLPLSIKSVAMVWGQQSVQIIQAMALMKGEATGFVGFMAGPWGAAITGAVTVLGMLAASHYDNATAEDTQKKAVDELAKAIKEGDAAARQSIQTSISVRAQAMLNASAHLAEARAIRVKAIAQLEMAKADLNSRVAASRGPGTQASDLRAIGIGRANSDIASLNAQIKQYTSNQVQAEKEVRSTAAALIAQAAGMDRTSQRVEKLRLHIERLSIDYRNGAVTEREYRQQVTETNQKITSVQNEASVARKSAAEASKQHRAALAAERKEQREAAKDAREHAKALKELQQEYDALIARMDPKKAAQTDIVDELARIDKFAAAGQISQGDALLYKLKAGEDYAKKVAEAIQADFIRELKWKPGSADDPFVQMAAQMNASGAADELAQKRAEVLMADPETTRGYRRSMQTIGQDTQSATTLVAQSWGEAARSVSSSLTSLANNIQSGGLLDILSGVIGLLTQLGQLGVFGGTIKTNLNMSATGHADGGLVGMATGGPVRGAGGPRTDNLLRLLSPGEYVVNAASTQAYLPFLEAINRGSMPAMLADGGLAGIIPNATTRALRMGDAVASARQQPVVKVMVQANDYFDAKVRGTSAQVAAPMAAQAGLAGASLAEARLARSRRNRIPGQ